LHGKLGDGGLPARLKKMKGEIPGPGRGRATGIEKANRIKDKRVSADRLELRASPGTSSARLRGEAAQALLCEF